MRFYSSMRLSLVKVQEDSIFGPKWQQQPTDRPPIYNRPPMHDKTLVPLVRRVIGDNLGTESKEAVMTLVNGYGVSSEMSEDWFYVTNTESEHCGQESTEDVDELNRPSDAFDNRHSD